MPYGPAAVMAIVREASFVIEFAPLKHSVGLGVHVSHREVFAERRGNMLAGLNSQMASHGWQRASKSVSAPLMRAYCGAMRGGFRWSDAASARRVAVGASLLLAMCARGTAEAADTASPLLYDTPDAPELALTWRAPAGCPSPTDVAAQFVRLLGGTARVPSGKHISASAIVRSSSRHRWTLELATVFEGAVGRRNLPGDSCASVAEAAALLLALMIDPAALERVSAPPAPAAPETSARAAPPAPKMTPTLGVSVPAPAPKVSRVFVPFARLFAGVVVGLLPSPAPAAGLALGVRIRRVGLELSLRATGQQRSVTSPEASGDFRLLVGGARACRELGGPAVVWRPCLGAELERLSGTGTIDPVRGGAALMGAGTAGLFVAVPLGSRVAVSVDLEAALRAYHPAFSDSGTQIFRIPLASGFAALGLVVTL